MGVASSRVSYDTIDRFPFMLTVVKRPKTTVAEISLVVRATNLAGRVEHLHTRLAIERMKDEVFTE